MFFRVNDFIKRSRSFMFRAEKFHCKDTKISLFSIQIQGHHLDRKSDVVSRYITQMKPMKIFTLLFIALVAFSTVSFGQAKEQALTQAQQKAFLSERLPNGALTGSFGSYGSLLFAVVDVAIHTDDKEIGAAALNSPFPEFYKPTWKELFAAIALQTQSSWKYDAARNYWVFAKLIAAKPFAVTLADKWTATDRGIYVGYKPPTFPVGMDIYYYGVYSADNSKEQASLWEKVRNSWAIGFASKLKKDVSVSEMQKIKVADVEALYFQTTAPRNNVVWRQWSFVKDGHAFVIVSTLRSEDKQLLSEVEAMVKSFRVVP